VKRKPSKKERFGGGFKGSEHKRTIGKPSERGGTEHKVGRFDGQQAAEGWRKKKKTEYRKRVKPVAKNKKSPE